MASPTLVAPVLTNNVWVTAGSGYTITGINTAMIDLLQGTSTKWNTLMVCAYSGGGGNPGGVVFTDLASGFTHTVTYPVSGSVTITTCPDVIVGNNTASLHPGSDLIVAVAYSYGTLPCDIIIDYFNVSYALPYTGSFTVAYNSSTLVATGVGLVTNSVHIDVVAEYSNTSLTGLPLCDKFFVTYDQYTPPYPGTYHQFYAAFGSLSSYGLISSVQNVSFGLLQDGWQPDVASVQFNTGSSVNYQARFSFVDDNNDQVYYAIWDAGPTGTGPNHFSFGPSYFPSTAGSFSVPRIDANDNYFTNGSISNENIHIACANSSTNEIRNYDDLSGSYYNSAGVIDLTTVGYTSIPSNFLPAVAFGPLNVLTTGHYIYMVTEAAEDPSHSPGDFFMQNPIDFYTASLSYDPSYNLSYFLVNKNYPEDMASCNYANSASTPCNYVSDKSLVAWAWNNGGTHEIDYKVTIYNNTAGDPGFDYRQSGASTGPAIEKTFVFPNPASNFISVSYPKGLADDYRICNMLGQPVLQGALIYPLNEINISGLRAGGYTLTIGTNNIPYTDLQFVKY